MISAFFLHTCFAEDKVCDDIAGEIRWRIESALGNNHRVKLLGPDDSTLTKNIPDTSVFLGFGDHGHAYLLMKDLRLDGYLFGPNTVDKQATLDRGMLFRFDLSLEQAEKVRNAIQRLDKRYSLTCIHTACKVLKQGGISLPVSIHQSFFLSPTFKQLLKEGAFDQKTGKPVSVEVYSFQDSKIESLIRSLKRNEKRLARPYLFYAGFYAGGVAAAVAGGAAVAYAAKTHAQAMIYLEPQPEEAAPSPAPSSKE
jgi:hypothetical protein